jgi:hypothetical protein
MVMFIEMFGFFAVLLAVLLLLLQVSLALVRIISQIKIPETTKTEDTKSDDIYHRP